MTYHFLLFIVCIVAFGIAGYIGYLTGRRNTVEEREAQDIIAQVDREVEQAKESMRIRDAILKQSILKANGY